MRRSFAKPALMLALVATLLRGLLPAGWMPNPQGAVASPFVICTMDGLRRLPMHGGPQHNPHNDQDRATPPCPFAAAAPLAPPAASPIPFQPTVLAFAAHVAYAEPVRTVHATRENPARAPPSLA